MPIPRTFGIGMLAQQASVKIETIRYYERSGLMPSPPRTAGRHRLYNDRHLRRLLFIRRCRGLGFSMIEIRDLVDLVDTNGYTCREVRSLTFEHAREVRRKIDDLRRLERTLTEIASKCRGDAVPECPIIDALLDPQTPHSDDGESRRRGNHP